MFFRHSMSTQAALPNAVKLIEELLLQAVLGDLHSVPMVYRSEENRRVPSYHS